MIFIVVPAIILLDRITKFFISNKIALNESVPVIKGALYFTLVHNRGAAFGILKNQVPFFILASVVVIVLISFNFAKEKHFIYSLSLGLILAGAIGNLIDRVFLGYVVDFIDFRIWPVFNLADSSITVGAILLGYLLLNSNVQFKAQNRFQTKNSKRRF